MGYLPNRFVKVHHSGVTPIEHQVRGAVLLLLSLVVGERREYTWNSSVQQLAQSKCRHRVQQEVASKIKHWMPGDSLACESVFPQERASVAMRLTHQRAPELRASLGWEVFPQDAGCFQP